MNKLYILKCKDKYKVGVTGKSIKTRITQLQTGNPDKIEVYKVYNTDHLSYKLESYIHRMCGFFRCSGEWFELKELELDEINRFITIELVLFNSIITAEGKEGYTELYSSDMTIPVKNTLVSLVNMKFDSTYCTNNTRIVEK